MLRFSSQSAQCLPPVVLFQDDSRSDSCFLDLIQVLARQSQSIEIFELIGRKGYSPPSLEDDEVANPRGSIDEGVHFVETRSVAISIDVSNTRI